MKKPFLQAAFFSISLFFFSYLTQAQVPPSDFTSNWPEWRGLYNSGAVAGGNTPIEFSETKNVKWKTEIPGKGHATPIIWGDQIILQTAVATGKKLKKLIIQIRKTAWLPVRLNLSMSLK
ncbi:MAG: hypothetical protein Q7W54_10670 [Bacteroidota bacterium]|nr:hypothetical protein [Bacteroidota bacterium]